VDDQEFADPSETELITTHLGTVWDIAMTTEASSHAQQPNADGEHTAAPADWHATMLAGHPVWRSRVLTQRCRLPHVFTARGCNLSRRSGTDANTAPQRRTELVTALGFDTRRLVCGAQVHGRRIACVGHDISEAAAPGHALPDVDGLVTRQRGVPLLALSADCPLIVLHDARAGALGLAHSGWRGTLAKMPTELVGALVEHCGASASRCVAVVSPCAGADAYEIREDVQARVAEATSRPERYVKCQADRMTLDLPGLIRDQLAAAGVAPDAIHLSDRCTISDDRFFSYRRDGANQGHAGLIVGMP
jgi:YfiH family protein